MALSGAVEEGADEHRLLRFELVEAVAVVVFAPFYLLLKFWYCNHSVCNNGNSCCEYEEYIAVVQA